MPTFLTNPKMNPALAARVRQSLGGDAAARQRSSSRMLPGRGVRRLALLAGLLALGLFLWLSYQKSRQEVEMARRSLQTRFARLTQTYDERARAQSRRISELLLLAAQKELPELRQEELLTSKTFDKLLTGDILYLRGAMTEMQSQGALEAAAVETTTDAFLVCLKAPAQDLKEASLLRQLGTSGSTLSSVRVHPMAELFALEAFLDSSFSEELSSAEHMSRLRNLDRLLSKAKLDQKQAAVSAHLLLYVIDEPLLPGARSDFDGEGHHHVRVGLVELPTFRVLLRVKREVSPEWISEKRRLSFSRPLDSCKLASELRRELTGESR